ncbi:LPS export ABC transporter periplasmic protein LptC [Glaciecola petra]|uniref:Lipopolysaccharide export system protein LptC n=1 Tax=Glaciecola petra TaxID=3075602 RepID=A0ABU2ZTM6_9ALTE|nr:LPS export ABC transporter periplasmic protein LptC [Aestuariibacter sp. P117]MDT0595992.1 LPS export ABC transporter periplasmic protein LptC [Aestuariibacter sp. P117]
MNRIGWSIALIFSAVLALYLPTLLEPEDALNENNRDGSLIPNYKAVNLNSKLYDKEGKLSHQMAAEQMEHYEELGFAVFTNPVYTLYLDSGEPWQVTANEATLHDNNRIQLEKNVKIVNLRTEEYVREINTEYIEINLQNKTLMSDQIVEISGLDYSVVSVGLFGDLTTQQYELKDHVQTQFKPSL